MVSEALPQLTAFPLEDAERIMRKAGYAVKVLESLPPGYRKEDDIPFRVVRQRLLQNNLVEFVVTIDFGKRG